MEDNTYFFIQSLPTEIVREIMTFLIHQTNKPRIQFQLSHKYTEIEYAYYMNANTSIYKTLFHKFLGGYRVVSISRAKYQNQSTPKPKPKHHYYINTEFLEFDCECQNERTDICNCMEPTKSRMHRKYVGNDFDYALLCYTTTI